MTNINRNPLNSARRIKFQSNKPTPSALEGLQFYDSTNKTISFYSDQPNPILLSAVGEQALGGTFTAISLMGAVNENKVSINKLLGIGAYTTKTNPAIDSISTADVDDYIGVVITTNVNNDQNMPAPTATSRYHTFTVINNDTSSSNIDIIGNSTKTLQPGEKVNFVWDGDAWIANEATGIWLDDGSDIKAQDSTRNLNMQSGNILTSADIGVTGSRITKGWFTDLEVTNDITIGGNALATIYANLGANADITSLQNISLYVGRDTDNRLNWGTDDQLDIVIAGSTTSVASISTGVGNNDKLVTQGYVDDAVSGENIWDRVTGTPNYVIPNTAADDIGATGTRITKGWFTDLEVTNAIAGSITGNAATVSTITGLAPDTATTQATQPNITSIANLDTVGTITTGTWNAGNVTSSGSVQGATGIFTAANSLTLGTASSADGGIIYQNATNANTVTLQSGATSTTYALTLPLAVGGAGEVLTDVAGDGVLSWGSAGGVAWGDTRTEGGSGGIGLTHTISASAAVGTQSFKTIVDNTQSNALVVNEVDLGSSAVAHIGLKITATGASTSQEAISITKGVGSGIKITDTNTAADVNRGAFQYASTSGGGTAFTDITGAASTQTHQSLNFNVSASGTATPRTSALCEILSDRGSTLGSTVNDNYNLYSITRRTNEGPLATFNSAGSVLYLENISVVSTGADTVDVLKLVQDADSTGYPINITQNAVVSTNFRKLETETNTAITRWYGNSADPNGTLNGTAGDFLINGFNNEPYYCTGTTNWVSLASTGTDANTALSNLSSVAINESLISDTDITDDLGTAAIRWNNIYGTSLNTGDTATDTLKLRAYDVDGTAYTDFITLTANNTPTCDLATAVTIGGNSILDSTSTASVLTSVGTLTSLTMGGDITSIHAIGRDTDNEIAWTTDDQLDFTIGGVTSAIASVSTGTGDNDKLVTQGYVDDAVSGENIWNRVTGTPNYVIPNTAADDIGATAARITKGWFTDLEVTNAIAGSITGNAATVTNATLTTALTVNTGTLTLTPNVDNTSVLTIGSGAVSVSGSNTGDQTTISGNAGTATALETARTIGGTSFDGTTNIVPVTITVADTADATCFVGLWESATGNLEPKTDTGLTYDATSGTLTATAFSGPLTGNVTGNVSGTAATVTGATQSAITTASNLVSIGTITTGVWNGTDIAVPDGGTGRGTATAYGVLCGGTTATGIHQSIASVGTAGQKLTSNGAAALPTFQTTTYAEMYFNNNSTAQIMNTANSPIGALNLTAGSLNGWTFDAGSTNGITVYADYGGTVAGTVLVTSATHGLTTGDIITIRGTFSYNGVFQITTVDASNFYITVTWVNDNGASDFDQPSYLEYTAATTKDFLLKWDGTSTKAAGTDATVDFIWYKNITPLVNTTAHRDYPAADNGSNGGGGIVQNVATGDRIFLTLSSDQNDNMTNSFGDVTITEFK